MKRNQPKDILQEKKTVLADLSQQANSAVDLVSRTINSLGLINQEIEDTVAEIESYTKELEGTRDALEKQRKNNTALIANFSKFLEVE